MSPRARSFLPLLLCAAACSSGPPIRTYVLTPPIDPTAPITTTPSLAGGPVVPKLRLELRRILIPDYLDSTDILMRSGSDEVMASTTGRWGERLSLGLTQALRADLAARMPQYSIVQDGSGNPQRQLRIIINALDLWKNGRCVLSASWSVVDQNSTIPVIWGDGTFDRQNKGLITLVTDANLVESIAGTLAQLADSIVAGIQARPGYADLGGGSKLLTLD